MNLNPKISVWFDFWLDGKRTGVKTWHTETGIRFFKRLPKPVRRRAPKQAERLERLLANQDDLTRFSAGKTVIMFDPTLQAGGVK